MLHGLIPVITRDIGMNKLGRQAFFLDSYMLEYLAPRIDELSAMDAGELEQLSRSELEFAGKHFTPDAFEKGFRDIIQPIANMNAV
jgi:hypothetical protein